MNNSNAVITALASSGDSEMANIGWDYGKNLPPELWYLLEDSHANGDRQSPIEIDDETAIPGAPALPEFHYEEISLKNFVFTSSHLEIEAPEEHAGFVKYDGLDYVFRNFHLHTPSEHTFEGRYSAMEIHAVHKWHEVKPDGQKGREKILVVGVRVVAGAENAELAKLVSILDQVRVKLPETKLLEPKDTINPESLYPKSSGYYYYEGSLTTPPCSENVVFFFYKEPITASCCQISQFKKFAPGGNNRPLQPLNGRKVYRSGT